MNLYRDYRTGKFVKYDNGDDPWYADVIIRYGVENGLRHEWKNIINIKDEEKRNQKIDDLIDRLEQNAEGNGFFKSQDKVAINIFSGFRIDDKEIYYDFFKRLRKIYNLLLKSEKKEIEGFAIFSAIKESVQVYFGNDKKDAMRERMNLTAIVADENDNFIPPSIKVLKDSGCGMCVEKSSVAHNLWLMCGKTSYYVTSKAIYLGEGIDQGHAFCLVEYDNKFRIFDAALGNYGLLDCNPIETIKDNVPFKVTNKNVPIVYVDNVLTNQRENNIN
ncbi:MAG: hypothetical protein IKY10_00850 [Clostridia bacterium]|nr:hypothetical protein [Clostridia bacterium]